MTQIELYIGIMDWLHFRLESDVWIACREWHTSFLLYVNQQSAHCSYTKPTFTPDSGKILFLNWSTWRTGVITSLPLSSLLISSRPFSILMLSLGTIFQYLILSCGCTNWPGLNTRFEKTECLDLRSTAKCTFGNLLTTLRGIICLMMVADQSLLAPRPPCYQRVSSNLPSRRSSILSNPPAPTNCRCFFQSSRMG